MREPPQLSELATVQPFERGDIAELGVVDRRGSVDLQQLEARRAQMRPADGPVVEPRDTERTSIAHTLAQDAPRVRKVPAVLPHGAGDRAVVVWLLLTDAVRL